MYIDFCIENNDEDSKFKVGDHTRISKYKNIFAKLYIPNLSDQGFQIKKVKNTIPQMYVISDLNGKRFTCTFMDLKQFTKKKKKKDLQRKKLINYMSNGKVTIIILTVGQIKKILYKTQI